MISYRVVIVIAPFFEMFSSHLNVGLFQIFHSSGLKSILEKLRFRGGLEWAV